MARVFVGVGSNLRPEENVREALRLLAREVRLAAVSTVYRTPALDRPHQPLFYNCAVEIETEMPPEELKRSVLRRIEQELGRVRGEDKYAPRTVDLDLLVYGDLVASSDDVVIPDPEIARRPFVAIPLAELAPDLELPGAGRRLREIAAELASCGLEPLADYTAALRREIEHER